MERLEKWSRVFTTWCAFLLVGKRYSLRAVCTDTKKERRKKRSIPFRERTHKFGSLRPFPSPTELFVLGA